MKWPKVEDILAFRGKVCDRSSTPYKKNIARSDRRVGGALLIGFELEDMLHGL